MTLCLAAGLDGIKRGLKPCPPVDANIFKLTEEEREEQGVFSLPDSLKSAIHCMKKDELVRKTLGDHIYRKYIAHKTSEWYQYSIRISQWEIDRYLMRY